MGYATALKKAGATLHAETSSGDYQGTWYAIITYRGMLGVCVLPVRESFGWDHEITDHQYAAFAGDYLDNIKPFEKVKAHLEESIEEGWDSQSAEETLEWLIEEWKKVSTNTVVSHFMDNSDGDIPRDALRDAVKRLVETGRLTESEPEPEVMIEIRITYPSGDVQVGYVRRYGEDKILSHLLLRSGRGMRVSTYTADELNATGKPWKPSTPS